jgi:hypothetical protein
LWAVAVRSWYLRPRTVWKPGGRGTSAVERRYQATAVKTHVDTSVRVTVNCKVWSDAVSKSPINPIINPKSIYIHSISITLPAGYVPVTGVYWKAEKATVCEPSRSNLS